MCFFLFCSLLLLNITTFVLFAIDKIKAKRLKWRISEATLIILSLLGGSVGALMAMQLFGHKTKKKLFRIGIPFFLILHAAFAAWLLWRWLKQI